MIELVDDFESEIMHEISHTHRYHDRLIRRDAPQRAAIEEIEVSVRHEHEIDRRQMMNLKAWLLQALDHLQPQRPVGIDQDVDLLRLNQKRSVTNPGDADLALANFGKTRLRPIARSLDEERWNQDAGKEISLVPVDAWPQTDARGSLVPGTVPGSLANHAPPAFL